MKVPYSWLREFVPSLGGDPAEVAQLLSESGTYVEAIREVGVADALSAGGEAFRIGVVRELDAHPDADKLRVAKVDVGRDSLQQIVCGAPNVAVGETVAVVLPGGVMPDGMKIKDAKLRGVESRGMLMSERELGLSTEHDGIMLLKSELDPGSPLGDLFEIGDYVLELEVTGNRADCLGILGVAREAITATNADSLVLPACDLSDHHFVEGDVHDVVSVELEAGDLCSRYMARALVEVEVAPSPQWLKARLTRAGMRPINNVVDVTNYVMLLTSQPLHAFDADQLKGNKIIVRRAHKDECVITLDDVTRTLDEQMLVIADAERTAVIAGVMGASDVEVTNSTKKIVLEAACFDKLSIQRTSRLLALRSESSSRFEKGLDPFSVEYALNLATRMLVDICGARVVPGVIDQKKEDTLPALPVIELPSDLTQRVLGLEISDSDLELTLTQLGFSCERLGRDGWKVTVPAHRIFDVTRPIDLVEELGRFRLSEIKSILPAIAVGGAQLTKAQRMRRIIEDTCSGMGLHEVVTYGLAPPGTGIELGYAADGVLGLANPATIDHAELRTSMVTGHLDVLARNVRSAEHDVAIFELGRTFLPIEVGASGDDGLPRFAMERDALAIMLTGSLGFGRWDLAGVDADFPAISGIVESVLKAVNIEMVREAMPNPPTWLHPGKCAQIRAGVSRQANAPRSVIGWVGALHPAFSKRRGLEQDVYAAHIDLYTLHNVLVDYGEGSLAEARRFTAISDFPAVVEDIALILKSNVSAGDILSAVRVAGGDLLESVTVFDRYVGAPIIEGSYSLALRMTYRAQDRTLNDTEAAKLRNEIVDHLAENFGAQLRDSVL